MAFAALLLPSTAGAQTQESSSPGWPCAGKVDPSYVEVAEESGGKVLLFEPSEIGGAAIDLSASDTHEAVVFWAGSRVAEGAYEFDVPVDSTIESVYFFVSLQCLESAAIVSPSGDEIRPTLGGVEHHEFRAIRLYTIQAPTPGPWKVRMSGKGLLTVTVRARTRLTLDSVTVASSDGPLRGAPRSGMSARLETNVDGESGGVRFHLLSPDAAVNEPVDLALEGEEREDDEIARSYAGEVAPSISRFRVAVSGVDVNGYPFQRVSERLFVVEE